MRSNVHAGVELERNDQRIVGAAYHGLAVRRDRFRVTLRWLGLAWDGLGRRPPGRDWDLEEPHHGPRFLLGADAEPFLEGFLSIYK